MHVYPPITGTNNTSSPSYSPSHCCSYFFDRPDDEAPEAAAASNSLATAGNRRAVSKSFGGHMASAAGQYKGERALRLGGGNMAFA